MASGYPDFRKNIDIAQQSLSALSANVDIVAQSIGAIAFDIVAQTLANLKVDINAQTLASVKMDIVAQTLGVVKMDITSQTVGKVAIDIAQQTLANLNINIASNTLGKIPISIDANTIGNIPISLNANTIGNIPISIAANSLGNLPVSIAANSLGNLVVDINAQSLGNLGINIAGQSLSQINQRPKFGAAQTATFFNAVTPNDDTVMVLINGTGIVYAVYMYAYGIGSCADDFFRAEIDGSYLEELETWQYIEGGRRYPAVSSSWVSWVDSGGSNIYFQRGGMFTFESSYAEVYREMSGRTPDVSCVVVYALAT